VIIFDKLFKPRKLPIWWRRFTDSHPVIPNLVAVTGMILICYSLAIIISTSAKHGNGQVVETFGAVSKSKPLIEKAINLRSAYHHFFPVEVRNVVSDLFGNFALYLVVPFLLFLEFLFPSNPSQPLIGKGFLQDVIWYFIDLPLALLFLFPVIGFLRNLFTQHLGFLILDSSLAWPVYLQILAAMMLAEFFTWFNHFVRHKVRTLWFFHAVHHSQKELNIFTDDRAHIVDLIVGQLLAFIPFFIFNVSNIYAVSIIALYKPLHNRFIHANLKINLGWLGWIFTSPQFHRLHHSSDPAHADKNFGVYFSIYDHLFKTAFPSRDVYPETGIDDSRFPTEDKVRISQLPRNWLLQVVYPFVQVNEKLQGSRLFINLREWFRLRTDRNGSSQTNIPRHKEPLRL
jgi:sterol desaturase/sphingolipid hydroxylase (fatty acid hydroxylase superfamily)